MAKKKRPAKAPAIGKNEKRELDRILDAAERALQSGHAKEYLDQMRRFKKKKRSFENKARWREGFRW